ncbi:glycosyltransferase family 2 protein [Agreia sp. PsM10]|uniref:glycosyltransferase family 2 protein n=1 Tax=Agreia sp. PsM10 TaxID=3030533 RepID=UPI00263A43AC|nr:glycosyltransferase family 2 protein [Agreia sp. PsM10]MDN4639319.1 glycosyltransferase family 2 protein [Agreia sp. PsM10]
MRARVTAVLVASNGADYLPRTLDALKAQTRQPDSLIVVDVGSSDETPALLSAALPTHFISASGRLSFGTAVAHALGVVPPPADENEWLWLLAHDTAPEPDALAALLAAVEVNPSVAAAGPKQMDWEHPDYISEFGETLTRFGATYSMAETELDQAQHDRMSDVLGVGAAGMLVRHTVWNDLAGFDDALPTADNGLDFSVRVRLAGHRVMGVPAARIASAGVGLAGPGRSEKGRARRKRQADRRAAQLHRRLVYAPAFAVVFHWLSLVPLAVARSLGQLVRKQPGAIGGEMSAAFRTAFGSRITEARKNLHAAKRVGWTTIAPLRIPGDEVRRRRSLQREIALTHLRGEKDRIQFIATGGVTTVLIFAVLGLVMFVPLIGAIALTGGSLLPVSATLGELWSHVGYGWRDIGLGFVGAADPFTTVLAVLGSITFWSPSLAVVGLYLAALPLAALAAWFLAARLTDKPWLRAVAAVLWTLAPPFLASLDNGAIGAVLAHLLLPWLVLAGLAARKSWSASAMAAILFAVTLAGAPSLWPALLVIWVVSVATAGRNIARYIGIPIPAVALFLPLAWDQFRAGNPIGILADPGVPVVREPGSILALLSGIPDSAQSGWTGLASMVGIDSSVLQLVLAIAVVPLGLLAVLALVIPGPSVTRAIVAVVGALLGLATAIASTRISLDAIGADPVVLWAGPGLSLYWLGLVCAAVIGLHTLKRFSVAPGFVAATTVVVVAVPLVASTLLGSSAIQTTDGRLLPAFVTAEAASTPRVGTLVLTPQPDGGLESEIVNGTGVMLDDQSTLASTNRDPARDAELAELIGNLASLSGEDSTPRLADLGVEFVLLANPAPGDDEPALVTTTTRSTAAFDANASLTTVGKTFAGTLWQITGTESLSSLPEPAPTNLGSATGVLVLVGQGIVFLLMLLLALPAGRLQPHGARAVSALEPAGPVIPDEPDSEGSDDDENADDGAEAPDGRAAETAGAAAPGATVRRRRRLFARKERPDAAAEAAAAAVAASTAAVASAPDTTPDETQAEPDGASESSVAGSSSVEMSEPTPTPEPETASAAQVESHAQAESHAQVEAAPQPVVIHPGEDFDLLGPAEPLTAPELAAEPETPSLDELVESPASTELPPIEAEPTTEFVESPEAEHEPEFEAEPAPEPEPVQAPQAEHALEPHRSEPEADPEPAFSHPRALPDDIDDDYDPDAETVMRVKPIDLSHEEDEHDGR